MKKTLLIIIFMIACVFISPKVYAYGFTATLPARTQASDAQLIADGTKYKYLKIVTNADSSDAEYTISFVASQNVSGINVVKPIGTANKKYTGTQKYITYVLPRVGMACPSDADYCFGAGKNDNSTTLIQGNECNDGWCSIYGIRVKNNKYFKDYNVTVTYNFYL